MDAFSKRRAFRVTLVIEADDILEAHDVATALGQANMPGWRIIEIRETK